MSAPDRSTWRPMGFGRRRSGDVPQPLIEPLWEGIRVLVHVEPDGVARIVDGGGTDVRLASVLATSAVTTCSPRMLPDLTVYQTGAVRSSAAAR